MHARLGCWKGGANTEKAWLEACCPSPDAADCDIFAMEVALASQGRAAGLSPAGGTVAISGRSAEEPECLLEIV